MTTPNKQWMLNTLATNLLLKNGYIDLVPGGNAEIFPSDLQDPSIQDALSRGMIVITDTQPATATPVSGVELTIHKPYTGISAEELKALQANSGEAEPVATSESIPAMPAPEPAPEPDDSGKDIESPAPVEGTETAPAPKAKAKAK